MTTYALSDTSVMITRSMRRSLRDPEAFFTALMLPIILMLLFVYIFGGDLNTGGKYVNYVVPGLIVLCAGFGAGTTAVVVATDMSSGIVDRFRSMPIHALVGAGRAHRRQPGPQPARDRAGDRGRPRRRLASDRLAAAVAGRGRHDRGVHLRHVVARGRVRPAGRGAPRRRPGPPSC